MEGMEGHVEVYLLQTAAAVEVAEGAAVVAVAAVAVNAIAVVVERVKVLEEGYLLVALLVASSYQLELSLVDQIVEYQDSLA